MSNLELIELRIRILREKCKGNVQAVLEYAPLKPQKFGVFLRILSQIMQHCRAGTVQLTDRRSVFCHCVITSHNYILALYHVKVKTFSQKSEFFLDLFLRFNNFQKLQIGPKLCQFYKIGSKLANCSI